MALEQDFPDCRRNHLAEQVLAGMSRFTESKPADAKGLAPREPLQPIINQRVTPQHGEWIEVPAESENQTKTHPIRVKSNPARHDCWKTIDARRFRWIAGNGEECRTARLK
jgi:hypothetical protein